MNESLLKEISKKNLISRSHPLRLLSTPDLECSIKRDDELSFGISGSKLRKYRSLVPFLKKEAFAKVGIVGSLQSNNVLGLVQKLKEEAVSFQLFLLKPKGEAHLRGNALLLSLFDCDIHWIERKDWSNVEKIANNLCDFVIPEGSFMKQSLLGSLTLGYDITTQGSYNHIFVDAGTGMQALGLLLYMSLVSNPAHIHIVLMADQIRVFQEKLLVAQNWLQELYGMFPTMCSYTLYKSYSAKAFGSVNSTILQFIKEITQSDGILLDPIYSAKLFYSAKQIIIEKQLKGSALCIHSGGGLSLFSFEKDILKLSNWC